MQFDTLHLAAYEEGKQPVLSAAHPPLCAAGCRATQANGAAYKLGGICLSADFRACGWLPLGIPFGIPFIE